MRSIFLIITLFAFFAPITSYADDEMPDSLMYNGKKYPLEDTILKPYLEKANKWEWLEERKLLEIVNNELILKDIKGNTKLDWFTDSIVIGINEPIYGDVYEYYSILHFEKGMLIKETRMDYKEYLGNKLKKGLEKLSSSKNQDFIELETHDLEYEHQAYLDVIDHYMESKKEDKSEFLTELKTRYKKKFRKSMSDIELKIQQITFWNGDELEITRTLDGARAKSNERPGKLMEGARAKSDERLGKLMEVRLNIEEWLDIINALSTCCFDKWKLVPKPISSNYYDEKGIYVYFSSENRPYDELYKFSTKSGQPPNLKEAEKVMKNIIAKMKKSDKYLNYEFYQIFSHGIP